MAVEPAPFQDYDIRELVCIIHELNRKRFYRIEVAPGLFGPMIIRAWGRIGCRVRVKTENFACLADALTAANRLYRTKRKKGYCEVKSIVDEKIAVHPEKVAQVRTRRVGEGEPTLPGFL